MMPALLAMLSAASLQDAVHGVRFVGREGRVTAVECSFFID